MAADEPQCTVYGGGVGNAEERRQWPTPAVVVKHQGYRLIFRFADGDMLGEGPVQKLELLPDTEPLEPRLLRQFAPQADVYLAYARAAMRWMNPDDGSFEQRQERLSSSADALRKIGGPGRGLKDEFYRRIAEHYQALVDGGEPHPVKTIGETHHVTISAASRWIKEARRRGFIVK